MWFWHTVRDAGVDVILEPERSRERAIETVLTERLQDTSSNLARFTAPPPVSTCSARRMMTAPRRWVGRPNE